MPSPRKCCENRGLTTPSQGAAVAPRGRCGLFECIRPEMRKGSPEGYNDAETGPLEPAQKAQTGEPHERTPLYRIRRPQEKHQLLRETGRWENRRRSQASGEGRDLAPVGPSAHRALARGDGGY